MLKPDPPQPCPHLYQLSGPGRKKEDWYDGGTVCHWTDGYRAYFGLVRGDGLVLAVDDKGPATESGQYAYMVPRPVNITFPVFKNLFNMLLRHPLEKNVSGICANGNSIGIFVRGETSAFRYEDVVASSKING